MPVTQGILKGKKKNETKEEKWMQNKQDKAELNNSSW